MQEANALQKLDTATRMLAEVRTAEDAKHVMDVAAAAEHFARKHKLGEEAIGHAHAIKVEAAALLGELLDDEPKAQGTRGQLKGGIGQSSSGGVLITPPDEMVPSLEKLGIDKNDAKAIRLLRSVKHEEPEEFEKIKTRKKKLSQVKRERTKKKALSNLQEFPSGRYRVIYADPPWKYGDTLSGDLDANYGGAEKHYPAMTITELAALPVKEVADENAVLFLWVTSPLLFESEPVFKAWGFKYKSAFIWDKIKHNMGHYNSVRHELLLICTRGSCTPDKNKLFDSVQSIERSDAHSEKPEEFRSIIDTLYPYGRRLELFARGDVPPNWNKWGAEA